MECPRNQRKMLLSKILDPCTRVALIWVLSLGALGNPAEAANLYTEWAGGLSQMSGSSDFFAGQAPAALKFGLHTYTAIGLNISDKNNAINIHLLTSWRMSNSLYGTTQYYTMHSVYPLSVRIEANHLGFAGFGATPLLWSASGESVGLIPMERVAGRWGFMAEAGIQYPVIPTVTVTFTGAVQSVLKAGSTISPKLSLEAAVGMRFYFGPEIKFNLSDKFFGQGSKSNEYEGYRYPYGIPKK